MSRQLPKRPNLEYLRKQAKELLDARRHVNPSEQLADAQHALACEYGFASWPNLKAHVESLVDARSPFVGHWNADVARSKRHPANEFRSAAIIIEVEGDDVRLTDVVVDASGREERHVNTVRADGQEHASEGTSGFSLTAKWRDVRTLETVARKGGQVVGSATYEVSADGRTLTITGDEQLIVLGRADRGGV